MNLFSVMLILLTSVASSSESSNQSGPIYEKLKAAVHQHVVGETGKSAEDIEVQWLGYAANIPCAAESDVWVSTLPGEQFRGQSTARVTFVDASGVCGKVSVPFKTAFWSHVPVATADIQSGNVVEFELKRVLT